MKTCPECNGKKGFERILSYCWEEPQETEWIKCGTCRGGGEVTDLKYAIYEARGGPAPNEIKGYA